MRTERLIIRKMKLEDADSMFRIRQSDYVMRYNAMKYITLEEYTDWLKKAMKEEETYHIELKDSKEVIGAIDICEDSLRYGVKSYCLSYYLGEQYARKGYMKEAVKAMIHFAFQEKEAEILAVRAFHGNEASIKLIESLGFVKEGQLRHAVKGHGDIVYDDLVFSMLREEYDQLVSQGKL